MIWVVTAPGPVPDEISLLRDLFSAGLETLLLRKPGWSAAAYETLLQALPADCRDRVMLSGYPELVARYGLKGLHLSERLRREVSGWGDLRGMGICVSTSVHEVSGDALVQGLGGEGVNTSRQVRGTEHKGKGVNTSSYSGDTRHDSSDPTTPVNPKDWDFLVLGPVFDSISKAGYKGRSFGHIPHNAIAIGGVTPSNLEKLQQMGFYGAAMLGAIWQQPEHAVEIFIKAKTSWK